MFKEVISSMYRRACDSAIQSHENNSGSKLLPLREALEVLGGFSKGREACEIISFC